MSTADTALYVAIGAAVVAGLALLLAIWLFVRQRATSCMESQFQSQLGSQVDVGLSWKPVLLQMTGKSIPYVTIDSAGAAFEQFLHSLAFK